MAPSPWSLGPRGWCLSCFIVVTPLLKCHCLAFLLYASEAVLCSLGNLPILDNCMGNILVLTDMHIKGTEMASRSIMLLIQVVIV